MLNNTKSDGDEVLGNTRGKSGVQLADGIRILFDRLAVLDPQYHSTNQRFSSISNPSFKTMSPTKQNHLKQHDGSRGSKCTS